MTGELAFVDTLRTLASDPAARGLDDDCAVLEVGGETLVLTHDVLVEGVHVLPGADPADIAWKLVAANMSDLAAKGARPLGVLLGYALGKRNARFAEGLKLALAHFGAPLLGGDTVAQREGPRSFGLTAIGAATHRPVPARSGAGAGDDVFVTGRLGAAMIGLEAARAGNDDDAVAYLRPDARLAEGQALAPHVTAMMDISDGLLLDAWRMARASKTRLSLQSTAVPIAVPENRRDEAMRWGEDFELLFTAPPGTALPVPATRIGTVCAGSGIELDAEILAGPEGLGYSHG